LDGRVIAGQIQDELRTAVGQFVAARGFVPGLAAVLVGDDAGSQVYVRNKSRACERVGIRSEIHRLPADAIEADLLALVQRLNDDSRVHGILVQLPLPPQIHATSVLDEVEPRKDVDAFHPVNVGLLTQGRPRFLPCTPHGIQQLLHRSGLEVTGKEVVVVGRSEIVGKPIAIMLAQRDSPYGPAAANATVTICHSRTSHLADVTRRADILIAAIGRPKFISADMVKPGAAVIDVGINRTDDGLVGDVDFDAVKEVAGHITPVPGGVGPLTVAMLLHNTLAAALLA
jgi:methylenetetrahydrofolate dehydrogenase (NADP+)/methenyltetrahydrofolate cyclohydrolase